MERQESADQRCARFRRGIRPMKRGFIPAVPNYDLQLDRNAKSTILARLTIVFFMKKREGVRCRGGDSDYKRSYQATYRSRA